MGDTVPRHTPIERAVHWLAAGSGVLLLFSGFGEMPMYDRFYLTSIPGLGWANNYGVQLTVHYLFAAVFCFATVFHVFYHWRRREFAILPRRGDIRESIAVVKAIITRQKEPPHGKFLAEQRLAYLAFGVTSLALIATGLIKTYKNTGPVVLDPIFLNVVTYVHTFAMLVFLLLLVAHLGAFVIKANRPLFGSMFSGSVDREYARSRHPKWKV